MKISIVTGFFLPIPPVRGGATEKIWFRLAQEFAAAGHEVVFVSRRWPSFPDKEKSLGIQHLRRRGANHTRYLALNLLHDFIWGIRAAWVLPAADIAVCNCVALPVWLGWIKRRAGKVVAVVARMPKGQGRFYGRVDLILSLSEAVTQNLRTENAGLRDRIRAFPFPIDWRLHAEAAVRRRSSGAVTVGYIGRLHPEKGIALLLQAAGLLNQRQDLPPWRLKLLGPVDVPAGGGGRAWLHGVLAEQGVTPGPQLELCEPEFDPTRLAEHYASIDIFAYPSLAEKGETFGVAVAEAMAAKCAPVVSGLACFNELINDEKTGLIFDHTAPDASVRFAAALARLIQNASLRDAISTDAQAWAQRFDYAIVAAGVLNDFREVAVKSDRP